MINIRTTLGTRTNEEENQVIGDLLLPETSLEKKIIGDLEFRRGLFWGTPRYGHPEGQIIFHIREVFDNIDKIPDLSAVSRERLRLVALIHDTFKYKEYAARKIFGRKETNHHAVFAANFAKQYIEHDPGLIEVIRLHDEPYYCWRYLMAGRTEEVKQRMEKIWEIIGEDKQLFYLFFKCDTQTGDKNQTPLQWFESDVKGIEVVSF